MYQKFNKAAVVDLDIDFIDFPQLKDRISARERKKLVTSLEKYSGSPLQSKVEIPRATLPLYMQSAFPKEKLSLTSTDSVLEYRKIRDIPRIVYDTFRNSFLGEKAGKVVTRSSASNSSNMHGISQSFESISKPVPQPPRPMEPVPLKSQPATIINLNSDLDLGRDSFMASTMPSQADLKKDPEVAAVKAEEPTNITVTTTPTIAPRIFQRTPSFFERLLNMAPNPQPPPPPVILQSADSSIDSELSDQLGEYVKETFEKIIHQDGHELHQLLCHLGSQANIDNEESEDYVDRFTTVSFDSDDVTKSDSGTQTDSKSVVSTRSQRGSRPSKTWEVFGRKKTENPKIEKIRKTCKPECGLCFTHFDFRVDDAFMCKRINYLSRLPFVNSFRMHTFDW